MRIGAVRAELKAIAPPEEQAQMLEQKAAEIEKLSARLAEAEKLRLEAKALAEKMAKADYKVHAHLADLRGERV